MYAIQYLQTSLMNTFLKVEFLKVEFPTHALQAEKVALTSHRWHKPRLASNDRDGFILSLGKRSLG